MSTYTRSLGSGEADVSRLASGSSWARRSTTAILSRGTLEGETGKGKKSWWWLFLRKWYCTNANFCVITKKWTEYLEFILLQSEISDYSQQVPPFREVQSFQGFLGDPVENIHKLSRYTRSSICAGAHLVVFFFLLFFKWKVRVCFPN